MSYYRPARKEELVEWLVNTFGEDEYGIQTDAEDLANRLVEKFDVVGEFRSPS